MAVVVVLIVVVVVVVAAVAAVVGVLVIIPDTADRGHDTSRKVTESVSFTFLTSRSFFSSCNNSMEIYCHRTGIYSWSLMLLRLVLIAVLTLFFLLLILFVFFFCRHAPGN